MLSCFSFFARAAICISPTEQVIIWLRHHFFWVSFPPPFLSVVPFIDWWCLSAGWVASWLWWVPSAARWGRVLCWRGWCRWWIAPSIRLFSITIVFRRWAWVRSFWSLASGGPRVFRSIGGVAILVLRFRHEFRRLALVFRIFPTY